MAVVRAAILDMMTWIFSQPELVSSATYIQETGRVFSEAQGRNIVTTSDTTVSVADVRKSFRVMSLEDTPLQFEGVSFVIQASDLPSGATLKDKLTVGLTTYQIRDRRDYLDVAHGLIVEAI
jgi:hypothetical protein